MKKTKKRRSRSTVEHIEKAKRGIFYQNKKRYAVKLDQNSNYVKDHSTVELNYIITAENKHWKISEKTMK